MARCCSDDEKGGREPAPCGQDGNDEGDYHKAWPQHAEPNHKPLRSRPSGTGDTAFKRSSGLRGRHLRRSRAPEHVMEGDREEAGESLLNESPDSRF
jgi:hypothetical protein